MVSGDTARGGLSCHSPAPDRTATTKLAWLQDSRPVMANRNPAGRRVTSSNSSEHCAIGQFRGPRKQVMESAVTARQG